MFWYYWWAGCSHDQIVSFLMWCLFCTFLVQFYLADECFLLEITLSCWNYVSFLIFFLPFLLLLIEYFSQCFFAGYTLLRRLLSWCYGFLSERTVLIIEYLLCLCCLMLNNANVYNKVAKIKRICFPIKPLVGLCKDSILFFNSENFSLFRTPYELYLCGCLCCASSLFAAISGFLKRVVVNWLIWVLGWFFKWGRRGG